MLVIKNVFQFSGSRF